MTNPTPAECLQIYRDSQKPQPPEHTKHLREMPGFEETTRDLITTAQKELYETKDEIDRLSERKKDLTDRITALEKLLRERFGEK